MKFLKTSLAAAAAVLSLAAQAGPTVTTNTNALALANAITGSGITIIGATLTTDTTAGNGTFTGGTSTVGFDAGVVLTTGALSCVPGPNNSGSCSGAGASSELSIDFTSTTGAVFFQYVFGSEEYNEFVGSIFNDTFALELNGTNIALVPGGGGVVSINNVNCTTNSAYYRNNSAATGACANSPNLSLDIQYDGLTVILTASGTTQAGLNNFKFRVTDVGDSSWDSGVFIKEGSFSGTGVPEPGSLALVGAALAGLAIARRRKA